VRPAFRELGIEIGGWHDFRHSVTAMLRRSGTHPKVVSDILGHSKVNLAMDVYDRTNESDFGKPLEKLSSDLVIDPSEARGASTNPPAYNHSGMSPLGWSSTLQFMRPVKKA
jgi:hypothetical protein